MADNAKGTYIEGGGWKCNICGKVCKNEGGLNLHWAQKHADGAAKGVQTRQGGGKSGRKLGDSPGPRCPDCGAVQEKWRLLNERDAEEAQYLRFGGVYVCGECDEIIDAHGRGLQ